MNVDYNPDTLVLLAPGLRPPPHRYGPCVPSDEESEDMAPRPTIDVPMDMRHSFANPAANPSSASASSLAYARLLPYSHILTMSALRTEPSVCKTQPGRTHPALLLLACRRKVSSARHGSTRAVPHLFLRVPPVHPAVRPGVRHVQGPRGTRAVVLRRRSRRRIEDPHGEWPAERHVSISVSRRRGGLCGARSSGLHYALEKLADASGQRRSEEEERHLGVSARIWLSLLVRPSVRLRRSRTIEVMLTGGASRVSLGTGRPILLKDESSIRHCRI